MRFALLTAAALIGPTVLFAAGGETSTPPTQTNTTTECATGTVWNADTQSCEEIKESSLSPDALYENARELAYHGRFADARAALEAMDEADSDRVLTYMGFTARKEGRMEDAMTFYKQALSINPDNLAARSYMGQAFVETGAVELAAAQLTEIRTRGGRGSWPEVSLRLAIENGQGFAY
ncbi:tetratricopeptide repeat protein [Nereida sp. MMG025]|uniref:tetratricopeptide repeat protein n=1 Tax=Nereida sp. MMG025 TaxID=2909981 RepID=UPI001F275884|nr:tetratricopeptide repeat protein [Nereida sp. MMG025]MCF6443393.1 tetratricopeptide repeat protein [Nereida sp. MMG025]